MEVLLTYNDGEPCSLAELEGHTTWSATRKLETEPVDKNQTWELADLPPSSRMITLKWVYKLKKDKLVPFSSTRRSWWHMD